MTKTSTPPAMAHSTPKSPSAIIRVIVALCALLGAASIGSAQSYSISPSPFLTVLDNSGHIVNNACVWTYLAGTSTPATTYSDNIGTTNSNPIRADSAGRFTAFLVPGVSYKFIYEASCTPPSHGTVYRTADNIGAVPLSAASVDVNGTAGESISAGQVVYLSDGSGSKTPGQWYKADSTNLYSSTLPEVGIVSNAISSGNSGTIRLMGNVSGLSVSAGAEYYVSTAGTMASTSPANMRHLGHADSATSLVLTGDPAVQRIDNSLVQGRLTLTTAVPITTGNVTAATAIKFTPYRGNQLALYNGAIWTLYTFTELSIAVPATTVTMYDLYVYDNAGTLTLDATAWTNDTTRATALATQDGVLCKTGALPRRYLGSFRTTGVSGQTEDSLTKRYLWNYYHRVPRALLRQESTATWNYTTATIRQANAAAANQVELVVGVAEEPIDLTLSAAASNGQTMVMAAGIGEDSTTTISTSQIGAGGGSPASAGGSAVVNSFVAKLIKYPVVGFHFYAWLEWSAATGTTTWYGAPQGASSVAGSVSGLSGWFKG